MRLRQSLRDRNALISLHVLDWHLSILIFYVLQGNVADPLKYREEEVFVLDGRPVTNGAGRNKSHPCMGLQRNMGIVS